MLKPPTTQPLYGFISKGVVGLLQYNLQSLIRVKFLNRRYFGDPKTSKSKQEIVDDINNLAEIVRTKKQFDGTVEPKDLVILLETFDSFQGEKQQQLSSELICG